MTARELPLGFLDAADFLDQLFLAIPVGFHTGDLGPHFFQLIFQPFPGCGIGFFPKRFPLNFRLENLAGTSVIYCEPPISYCFQSLKSRDGIHRVLF
ncbi:hypothetical protein LJC47_07540 [Desulfosarcina sp. OttesenSCG-928-B08]|nr:hypothetical protein [Desulfosarcina sp. OttesenSCG-928-B08]